MIMRKQAVTHESSIKTDKQTTVARQIWATSFCNLTITTFIIQDFLNLVLNTTMPPKAAAEKKPGELDWQEEKPPLMVFDM